ncbi:MAG: glycoside hydrolase family 140 protein [Cytophagales bacterium]|nr:glycoside hydrolase family 140 protein [Cytophagales bacterium]
MLSKKPLLLVCLLLSFAAHSQTAFPLKISADKRHLTDQKNVPFLYVSDSGWRLFTNLTEAEAKEYLLKRKSQGFNTIHVMLTAFPGDKNRQGQEPFENNDFLKTNEAYFRHVDRIVAMADSLNLLLAVAPLWYSCCNDGWGSNPQQFMRRNGKEKCYLFGQFVGNRYKKYNNIVWIIGGDNDPFEYLEEVRQLARGLKQASPQQLLTYHAASTHSSTDVWPANESWLDFSMVYSYFRGFPKAWNKVQPDVYEVSYAEHRKHPVRPFVLGESTYEGEHEAMGSALQARKQAWWAVLSGACGHSYGSPFWKGDAQWRTYLDLPGANTLRHLNALLATFDWTTLVPDVSGELLTKGNEKYATNDYATAALTRDRKLAVVYVPSARGLTVNTALLTGKLLIPTWYNPRTGERRNAGRYPVGYKMLFESPDANDWVLVLKVEN